MGVLHPFVCVSLKSIRSGSTWFLVLMPLHIPKNTEGRGGWIGRKRVFRGGTLRTVVGIVARLGMRGQIPTEVGLMMCAGE